MRVFGVPVGRRRAVRSLLFAWFVFALGCAEPGPPPASPRVQASPVAVAGPAGEGAASGPALPATALQDPEGASRRGRAPGAGHRAEDGAVATAAAQDPAAPDDEGEEDEDEKDYWAGIDFTRRDFDQVRRFVQLHYIDEQVDEKRAYIEAAIFALVSSEKRPLEILPESFYQLRREHPDEEGRLEGRVHKLRPADRYVVHEVPKDEAKPRRALSDDDIRQLRLRDQARNALLERHWRDVPFDERDFSALLQEAEKNRRAEPGFRPSEIFVVAAEGFLYSLDPHSSLVSAAAWEESTRETEDASFDGIGAVLTQRDNQTLVESPIEGQPAQKVGLRAGDAILQVDHKDISGIPLFKVVKRIRGPRGTKVTLTIRRVGAPNDFDLAITRAHIDVKNVSGRMLAAPFQNLAYVKMTGFVRSTAEAFDELMDELTRQSPAGRIDGLVFDLRNNNGGLLAQGIAVADRFLSEGIIVTVRNKSEHLLPDEGPREEVYRATPGMTVSCPVVVLVNDGTASAAEIVASALQENGRALVVGDRTYGKASVQTLYPPPGQKDYFIKLTVARYYAPSGQTIQIRGVLPDVLIPPDVDGAMPLGFREENLRNPLSQLVSRVRSPWADRVPALDGCVKATGQAEKLNAADPNPQIKFDNQLMKGADYLECLVRERAAATAR